MSALNILRKKGTILALGEDELLAEMVRSYPCFYDKTWKEHKERKNMSLKRKKETIVLWSTFKVGSHLEIRRDKKRRSQISDKEGLWLNS